MRKKYNKNAFDATAPNSQSARTSNVGAHTFTQKQNQIHTTQTANEKNEKRNKHDAASDEQKANKNCK